jgi:hypothetical protein
VLSFDRFLYTVHIVPMSYAWFQLPLKHSERNKSITTDLTIEGEIAEIIITLCLDTVL